MRTGFFTLTLFVVLLAALAVAAAHFVAPPLAGVFERVARAPLPCEEPVTYSMGSEDARFGLSRGEFVAAMRAAEKAWEDAAGRDLFDYAPEGGVKVSLVYDSRQETTERLRALDQTLVDTERKYERIRGEYEELQDEYMDRRAALDSMVETLIARKGSYDREILYWNGREGVPSEAKARLAEERAGIEAARAEMEAADRALSKKLALIEERARTLSGLAAALDAQVMRWNEISGARGEVFEEGVYRRDPSGVEIEVYQFETGEKLVRVLAHEFGHALGLDHIDDARAIMYHANQGGKTVIAESDLEELARICGGELAHQNSQWNSGGLAMR